MNACASPDMPAVEVLHLCKSYGETVAADDVSFSVAEGEIFGILGPNGGIARYGPVLRVQNAQLCAPGLGWLVQARSPLPLPLDLLDITYIS